MEHLGELTLADLVPTRPTTEQGLLLAEQVLRGLESLHKAGVLHRDLKPENVLVDGAMRLRLIDFGLAKMFLGDGQATTRATRAGDLLGTPLYMSPEQVHGEANLTAASDIWSFGVLLHELLAGVPPFQGATIMALGAQILNGTIDLNRPEVPASLRPFLGRCLERDISRRVPDAGTALKEFAPLSTELRRELRHERYRTAWAPVIEQRILEEFAAELSGKLPSDAVPQFRAYAAARGIPDLDEERLAEVLPAVFTEGAKADQAARAVVQAKQDLQREIVSLAAQELSRRASRIGELEESQRQAEAGLTATVRRLLADEVKKWEQVRTEQADQRRTEMERALASGSGARFGDWAVWRITWPGLAAGGLVFVHAKTRQVVAVPAASNGWVVHWVAGACSFVYPNASLGPSSGLGIDEKEYLGRNQPMVELTCGSFNMGGWTVKIDVDQIELFIANVQTRIFIRRSSSVWEDNGRSFSEKMNNRAPGGCFSVLGVLFCAATLLGYLLVR